MARCDVIAFVVPGPPYGKRSDRITSTGIRYAPRELAAWYELIGWHALRAGLRPVAAPVVTIIAIKRRPQRMPAGYPLPWTPDRRPCLAKPDCDNIAKGVCDALTRARAWRDDGNVFGLSVWTFYAAVDEAEHTEIMILDATARPNPGSNAPTLPEAVS